MVGDIVILNTGEEVPADGTLIEAVSLQVNESSLTGELMVNKTTDKAHFDEEATYPSNTVMRGTTITDGHGTMRVDRVGDITDGHGIMRVNRVGDATEIGKVARQATEQSQEQTPLNIQLSKLANLIGKVGFTIAALTFIIFTRSLCLPQRKCCKRLAPMAGYCAHRTEIFHDGSYTDCCSRARRTPDERYTESGFEHAPHAENKQSGA